MEFNLMIIIGLHIIVILILVHKIGVLQEKVRDYEGRLLINDRPNIPSSKELWSLWNERQFYIQTFYAIFPFLLKWKRKIVKLGESNYEYVPESVRRFMQYFTIER